ncbi:hypothetical protein B566_EDAN006017 [Ephemera danica]|nr:hypothetical protein B566_EDAN006017 [Ephemera danica]
MGLMCCRNSRLGLAHSVSVRSAAAAAAASKRPESKPEMEERISVPEMYSIVEHISEGMENEELHAKALQLWRSDRCHEALALYDKLLELELKELGKDHPRYINTNENRAHIMHVIGRHQEALDIFEDVIMARTLLLGRDHSDTIAAKLSLAALLERMARQSEALLAYDDALNCAERSALPQQAESALRGRARLLYEMGRYGEALYATDELLFLIEASQYPHDEQDVLTLWRNRAQCLQYTGRQDEAIITYREVLRMQETLMGIDHRDTLATAHSLAVLLDLTGARVEANKLYEGLLVAWRAQVTELSGTLGDRHPRTLQAKSCLASVLQSSSVGDVALVRSQDDFTY